MARDELLYQPGDSVQEALAALDHRCSQPFTPGSMRPELEQQRRPLRLAPVLVEHQTRNRPVGVIEAGLIKRGLGVAPNPAREMGVEHREEKLVLAREVRID